jgi:protein-disulfide isomerase
MTQETKVFIGIGLATVAIIVGGIFLTSKSPSVSPTERVSDTILLANKKNFKGNRESKVTIVEFSDFECPACAAAAPVMKEVMNKYNGKVQFIYRHFPLPQHTYGLPAAHVGEAAAEQGKFWEMHDLLFARQKTWAESSNPKELFVAYAKEIGLDVQKFQKTFDERVYDDLIQKDIQDGRSAGVNSTPTFFINGQRVVGVPRLTEISKLIDAELAK